MTTSSLTPESNVAASEALQIANNVAGLEYGLKAALQPIPSFMYPENPAQDEVVPHVDSIYGSISHALVLFFSLTNVGATWQSAKNLYYAKNKNLNVIADFGFNFLKTAAWFTFIGLAASGLVLIAPYLLLAMAGLGIGYGALNVGKHIYEAYQAHKAQDEKQRSAHLNAIPGQLLMMGLNGLGLLFAIDAGLNLSSQLADAAKMGAQGQFLPALMAIKAVGSGFAGLKTLFLTVAATATLGAITSKSTWEMNKQTLSALVHPLQTLVAAKDVFLEKCLALKAFVGRNPLKVPLAIVAVGFEAISLAAQAASRVIAFAATPLLLIGAGLRNAPSQLMKGMRFLFGSRSPSVAPAADQAMAVSQSTARISNALSRDHQQLKADIHVQLSHLSAVEQTPKIRAKQALLQDVRAKLGAEVSDVTSAFSLAHAEETARNISPRVYQSFWRTKGKTEQLAERAEALKDAVLVERARAIPAA